MSYAFLWALIGWGLASWVIVLLSLPDPPPLDLRSRFLRTSVAGIVGGVIGGMAVRSLSGSDPIPAIAGSNPMPGILATTLVGAAAGAIIFVGGLQAFSSRGRVAR